MSDARDRLTRNLTDSSELHDVFCGRCTVRVLARESPIWPGERWERIEPVATTRGGGRVVEEFVFRPAAEDDPTVPVAVVWDERNGAPQARLYYSPRLFGASVLRAPILSEREDLPTADVLERYFTAIRAGDAEGLRAVVTDGYVFQDPSGGTTQGRAGLDELFEGFAKRGGVPVRHCLVTEDEDEARSAVEFNSHSTTPAHAGLGIYDRQGDHLSGARIYE
jgi:SnoaL-like protein